MRKIFSVICICLEVFIIIAYVVKILPLFLPIKYAVKQLPQNGDEYIIVQEYEVTGYEWLVIGNQNGFYSDDSLSFRAINIDWNEPLCQPYAYGEPYNNQFICYGEYEYQPYDGVAGHNIYGEDVFHVERWEIMYPIQRDLFIGVFIPKNYICRYDMYYSKGYTFGEMLKGLYIWNYKSLPYREK